MSIDNTLQTNERINRSTSTLSTKIGWITSGLKKTLSFILSPIPIAHEARPINPPLITFELGDGCVESLNTQIIFRILSSSPALYCL